MKTKLVLVMLMVLFSAISAFSDVILEENFNYADNSVFASSYWHVNNYAKDSAFTVLGWKLYVNDITKGYSQSAFYDLESQSWAGTYKEARIKMQAIENGSVGWCVEFQDKLQFNTLGGNYNGVQIALNRDEDDLYASDKIRIKMMTRRVDGTLETDYDQKIVALNTFIEQEFKVILQDDGCRIYVADNGVWDLIYQGRVALGGITLNAFNSLMIRTGNVALSKGYVDAIRLYDEVNIEELKVLVDPIQSPVPEGSNVTVHWSVVPGADETNVLVNGIETPGESIPGGSYMKVVTVLYADTMTVEVFAVLDGKIAYSEPQIIKIIPSLQLNITYVPKKLNVLRPFQVEWTADKYCDRTYITVLVDGNLIYSGSNFKGFGPFKSLIKLDEVLPKKTDCTLYIYANAIVNGYHYVSEPKALDIVKGKESLEKKNAAKMGKIKKLKGKHLKYKK